MYKGEEKERDAGCWRRRICGGLRRLSVVTGERGYFQYGG